MQPSGTDKKQEAADVEMSTAWQDAWNRHDAQALAALVAPDVNS